MNPGNSSTRRTSRRDHNTPQREVTPLRSGDQDGRARLLAAGLKLFGERGYAATSITDLADEAGVTRGLIRFHFGSKEGLSDAVAQHVVDWLASIVDRITTRMSPATFVEAFTARREQIEQEQDMRNYLRRSFLEASPRNIDLFKKVFLEQKRVVDSIAAAGAKQLPIGHTWLALVSTFVQFGVIAFQPQVAAVLGYDPLSRGGVQQFSDVYAKLFEHLFNLDSIPPEERRQEIGR